MLVLGTVVTSILIDNDVLVALSGRGESPPRPPIQTRVPVSPLIPIHQTAGGSSTARTCATLLCSNIKRYTLKITRVISIYINPTSLRQELLWVIPSPFWNREV